MGSVFASVLPAHREGDFAHGARAGEQRPCRTAVHRGQVEGAADEDTDQGAEHLLTAGRGLRAGRLAEERARRLPAREEEARPHVLHEHVRVELLPLATGRLLRRAGGLLLRRMHGARRAFRRRCIGRRRRRRGALHDLGALGRTDPGRARLLQRLRGLVRAALHPGANRELQLHRDSGEAVVLPLGADADARRPARAPAQPAHLPGPCRHGRRRRRRRRLGFCRPGGPGRSLRGCRSWGPGLRGRARADPEQGPSAPRSQLSGHRGPVVPHLRSVRLR
mmetsp:Transcript_84273/g.271801  ORF Transcript_84273/g.271801 Transcript_84273/m.271801 type:complete len:279 (+) Transcript_84273:1084-1920(+)